MPYTVLARRYRPTTFDEVVGQDAIARTLRRAVEQDRVAHAYLFCGTRGVGKTTMARILAAALNCPERKGSDPCGECDICRAIHRGDDVDVLEIDGASNNSVEDVRTLRENAPYRPARARYKVYYIDEVHMLSGSAFNALLKTLEEPPGHVIFLFSTTAPEKLPATILSRCQRFDFRAVPGERIAEHLADIAAKEGVTVDPAALAAIAREGRGSVRDAMTLLDQVIAVGGGEVSIEAVRETVGAVSGDRIVDLLDACAGGDVGVGLARFAELLAGGADLGALLDQLLRALRDVLVAKTCGADAEMLDPFGPDRDALAAVGEKLSVPALVAALGYLTEARGRVRWASDGRPIAELAIVRMASLAEMEPLPEVLGRLDAIAESLTTGGEPPADEKKKRPVGLDERPVGGARAAPRPRAARPAPPRDESPGGASEAAAAAVAAAGIEAPDEDDIEADFEGPSSAPVETQAFVVQRAARRKGLQDALKDPLVRRVIDVFDGRIVRIDE